MRGKNGFSGFGISSLLVIFGVLCLVVFAVLSVATVQAHGRLSEKSLAAEEGYYQADAAAHRVLAELRSGILPENVTQNGEIYEYYCAISQTQTLAVRVRIQGQSYEILRWQAISTEDWEAEDKLPVWQG